MEFGSISEILQALKKVQPADEAAKKAAADRNSQLTKPPAALGRLEELAIWYAGWRGDARPAIAAPQIAIFAANHGVVAQGISAFPAEVTVQMVANFSAGGAAINQLANAFGATLDVHPLELDRPTADFTGGPAMQKAELCAAFSAGWNALRPDTDLLVTGEMGIGNTTAAAAVSAALFGGGGAKWAGRGTGLDDDGVAHKADVIDQGLAANPDRAPLAILQNLGGRELAAMAGAIAHARVARVPVILDGYICCAAAACLFAVDPALLDHAVAGHQSAETAHARLLDRLGKKPVLQLEMRLGEGSGAALAIGVLKGAIACHSGMATFAEAGVADG